MMFDPQSLDDDTSEYYPADEPVVNAEAKDKPFKVTEQYQIEDVIGEGAYGVVV